MASSLFSYETLVHAIAGATGSVVGMAVFYPLDTLRSRIQVSTVCLYLPPPKGENNHTMIPSCGYCVQFGLDQEKNRDWHDTDCTFTGFASVLTDMCLFEDSNKLQGSSFELLLKLASEEGLESLYRGLAPVLQSLSVSNFVYFYTFHGLRKMSSKDTSALKDLMFGIIAGSINVLLTSPLWVVNTRMKLEKTPYNSLTEGLIDLFKREGAKGLWSGTVPSLLLVSNPAIQFMVYESFKRQLISRGIFDTFSAFLVGAIAKAVATTLTYPLQLVQSRLRAGTSLKPLFRDVKSKPLLAFRGLEAKLMQTIMTAALMFIIYEKLVPLVLTIMRVRMARH